MNNKGQVMILITLILGGVMLSATTVAGLLMMYQIKQSTSIVNSVKAEGAANSGIEWLVYSYMKPEKAQQHCWYKCKNSIPDPKCICAKILDNDSNVLLENKSKFLNLSSFEYYKNSISRPSCSPSIAHCACDISNETKDCPDNFTGKEGDPQTCQDCFRQTFYFFGRYEYELFPSSIAQSIGKSGSINRALEFDIFQLVQ